MILEIYEEKLILGSDYTNMNGRMRSSAVFGVLQNAAFVDVTRLGAGNDRTRDAGMLWMIVHMHAEIIRLPEYCQEVLVRTWPGGGKHGMYTRYYEICDGRGNPVISASGSWVLVDARTRTLVEKPDIAVPCVTTGREIGAPKRLRLPPLENAAGFTAKYSHMDINGHMNNAKYIDVAEDIIGTEYLTCHTLMGADADYLCEVLPEESLTLRWGRQDETWYFQGETDKPCFRIRLQYR